MNKEEYKKEYKRLISLLEEAYACDAPDWEIDSLEMELEHLESEVNNE